MKWQGIEEFVHVAQAMSFTQAAKKMQVSTAQVSRQITLLEQRLKTKLLYRTTRKVSLTEEGAIYYQSCRDILHNLKEAELSLINRKETPQGKIKITAPVTFGEYRILPLVNNFISLYTEIEISANLTNKPLDLIAEGYDIAIRLGSLADSSLIAKQLSTRRIYVCASPNYIEKNGTPFCVSDLKKHNCLVGTLDHWHFNEKAKIPHFRASGRLHCNSGYALTDAALKSQGIVQLPDYYVQKHLDDGSLIEILKPYRLEDEGIWALYPLNRQLSPKVRLLVDYLAENLSKTHL